ncbi:S41 family peptidase [Flavobacterium sp.]|uniref:S41 family peptidase n=1 Tax=Flavobacterium sp. TaxID=239 RepID=UPI002604BC15|nr:S41 family peptidase [Flavobacterium sp.]
MKKLLLLISFLPLTTVTNVNGQPSLLSVKQQNEEFAIFKGGLQEGHSGLYYFITETVFRKKCDSIQNTFENNSSIENYYLKLRYLITTLNHGHTRISLPNNGNVNYRMAVLDTTKLYLPYEFLIVNKQLIIKEDCSKEQLFPRYSVVKSINNLSAKKLIERMIKYIPADGINQTFKYYSLYNYFYFNYLFNLFYPEKKGIAIQLENDKTDYYIELLVPKAIDNIYTSKNKKSISQYDKQLAYKLGLPNKTAYLKIGSFYKGFIENFGQKYEQFLDSTFTDIKSNGIQNVILDLRNNEGGGDGYDNILLSYLNSAPAKSKGIIKVPGSEFKFSQYTIDLSDDVKGFIANPKEFLRDDSSNYIKDVYVEMMSPENKNVPKDVFTGNLVVLINGGSFSATNGVVSELYKNREKSQRKIYFVGEENGGDIFCNTICAGQGYKIKLPYSGIEVDMPFLCFGELNKDYSKKRLPDYQVFETPSDLKANKDSVLNFAIIQCKIK